MSSTYTQIYIHIVFAVKGRQSLLPKEHKAELHQYIIGIITRKNQTTIQINSMPDHIHILVGITPDTAISDLVRDIKAHSSKFINKKQWIANKFEWQVGFGAFSYARSQLNDLIKYIKNQEQHHRQKTFREEYLEILKRFNVNYNEKYVYDPDRDEVSH